MANQDYTKFSKPESEVESTEMREGSVVDCARLNIRKRPRPNATIVHEIAVNTEVLVDLEESTDDYYKVTTASGVEGFCVKKFIAVR